MRVIRMILCEKLRKWQKIPFLWRHNSMKNAFKKKSVPFLNFSQNFEQDKLNQSFLLHYYEGQNCQKHTFFLPFSYISSAHILSAIAGSILSILIGWERIFLPESHFSVIDISASFGPIETNNTFFLNRISREIH